MAANQSNSVLRVISLLLIWGFVCSILASAHEADSDNEEITGNSARQVAEDSRAGSKQTAGAGGTENLPGTLETGLDNGMLKKGETELINTGKDIPVAKGKKHRLKMRLAGSMCAACLKELGKKLEAFKGIEKVKIDYPVITHSTRYSAGGSSNWAETTVDYYPNLASLDRLKLFLRGQGYNAYKIVDRPAK